MPKKSNATKKYSNKNTRTQSKVASVMPSIVKTPELVSVESAAPAHCCISVGSKPRTNLAETIPKSFWSKLTCLVLVLSPIYIGLLVNAVLSSYASEKAAISLIDQTADSTDSDWVIYKILNPKEPDPKDFSKKYPDLKDDWPTATWDPNGIFTDYNVKTSVRLELSVQTFTPLLSGASAKLKARLIVPDHLYDMDSNPPKPDFKVTCLVGSEVVESAAKKSPAQYFDMVQPEFRFGFGTLLQYPFDTFVSTAPVQCTYATADELAVQEGGFLNFALAIDATAVGFFAMESSVTSSTAAVTEPEEVSTIVTSGIKENPETGDDYTDDKIVTKKLQEVNFSPAMFKLTSARTTISKVFPMYFFFAMWIMALAQTAAMMPFYMGLQTNQGYAIPLACISLLFALPNLRNTLPGQPPLGIVLDFAGYFWNIIFAILNLGLTSYGAISSATKRGQRELQRKKVTDDLAKTKNLWLKTLTTEELVVLFNNTDRHECEGIIRKGKYNGPLIHAVCKVQDIAMLELPLTKVQELRLYGDIEMWKNLGVPREKVEHPPGSTF